MTPAERLRTRVRIAAQKFADELADAVLEATGQAEETEGEATAPKRRKAVRQPPPAPTNVDPEAAKRASAALAQLGIRRTG